MSSGVVICSFVRPMARKRLQTIAERQNDRMPSRLGFGTAALMARLGRRESVRLLEVAHESGITHFDTARAYGYGEAESALGEFLSRRREGVTVTTKLGIQPPRRSRGLDMAKATARVVARRVPAVRPLLRRRAESLAQTGSFGPGGGAHEPGDEPARAEGGRGGLPAAARVPAGGPAHRRPAGVPRAVGDRRQGGPLRRGHGPRLHRRDPARAAGVRPGRAGPPCRGRRAARAARRAARRADLHALGRGAAAGGAG